MRLDAYEVSLKTQFLLNSLSKHGITHSRDGVPVGDLPYEDLKRELAIYRYVENDAGNSEHAWF